MKHPTIDLGKKINLIKSAITWVSQMCRIYYIYEKILFVLCTRDKIRPKLVNMPKFVWIKYYSKLATCFFTCT